MANWSKTYTCNPVNISRLGMEIEDDGLTPNYLGAVDDGSGGADNLKVWFDAEVTGGELTTLDATIAAHGGTPPTQYNYYCNCCAHMWEILGITAPTSCPCCTSSDIITQATMSGNTHIVQEKDFDAQTILRATADNTPTALPVAEQRLIGRITSGNIDALTAQEVRDLLGVILPEEIFEHFTYNPNAYGIAGSSTYHLYGSPGLGTLAIAPTGGSMAKTTASELDIITGTDPDAHEWYSRMAHNPADYSYLEMSIRCKWSSAVDFSGLEFGFLDALMAWTESAFVMLSATPGDLKFVTTTPGGEETTDNITMDVTNFHVYTIKIKSGEAKFYIDGVLKATHTTRVPYDIQEGLIVEHYDETTDTAVTYTIDYFKVLLGRVF